MWPWIKINEILLFLDIDECAAGDPCMANAECENTEGSFTCYCRDGYEANPDKVVCSGTGNSIQ